MVLRVLEILEDHEPLGRLDHPFDDITHNIYFINHTTVRIHKLQYYLYIEALSITLLEKTGAQGSV